MSRNSSTLIRHSWRCAFWHCPAMVTSLESSETSLASLPQSPRRRPATPHPVAPGGTSRCRGRSRGSLRAWLGTRVWFFSRRGSRGCSPRVDRRRTHGVRCRARSSEDDRGTHPRRHRGSTRRGAVRVLVRLKHEQLIALVTDFELGRAVQAVKLGVTATADDLFDGCVLVDHDASILTSPSHVAQVQMLSGFGP